MASGKKMNAYEKAIAEQLQLRYGYKPAEAKVVLEEYRAVIGLIGAYPMASDYAEYFHQAKQEGRTGKEWISAIAKRREEAAAWAQ